MIPNGVIVISKLDFLMLDNNKLSKWFYLGYSSRFNGDV